MTIREAVSRMRHDLNSHYADSSLYNRHLYSAFWAASRLLIQREADQNRMSDQSRAFTSYNLDTEQVDMYEATCVPLSCISCRAKLPAGILTSKTGPIYGLLGSPDLSTRYAIVTPMEFEVKSKIKGTSARYAYIENGYLYLSKCIPCLKLLAVPSDVPALSAGGTCSVLDSDVPVPDHLHHAAFALAKEAVITALGKPYDTAVNKTEV
jgi:hypothetical protein